jgi:myo-inositol-1-phosphate synthase
MKILIVGMNGAISTTLMAGVRRYAQTGESLVGSVVYAQFVDESVNGAGAGEASKPVRDAVGAPNLEDVSFAGWDVQHEDPLEAAREHDVLDDDDLEYVPTDIQARPGVVGSTSRCDAPRGVEGETEQLLSRVRNDIEEMTSDVEENEDVVMVWLGSTEASTSQEGIDGVASRIYARAAIENGIPFINGSPQNTMHGDLLGYANDQGVPVAGRDLKTGQTLVKSSLASMMFMRSLGLEGWFSTNILGNSDGKTLQDEDAFASKERSKTGLLGEILDPEAAPHLYEEGIDNHQVNINYYPPKGDNKEGWDAINLFGWMDYPMELKVNFLCRDSILAAPLVLDLSVLTSRLAQEGAAGAVDSLGFYFKDPVASSEPVDHELGRQFRTLMTQISQLAH